MTLSQERLAHLLAQPFRYYDSVDSTNDIAQNWLREGAAPFSVVLADEQRKGRGRKGRYWYTPPGVALAVSVILKPTPQQASKISMLGALAVAELCDHAGIAGVGIKWPNDVQIHGKKVSGVLPEAVWLEGDLLGVVLGMGVNIRVQFAPEIAPIATNIEDEVAHRVDRAALIMYLLGRVTHWMAQDSDALFAAWRARLNTIGQHVQVDGIVGQAVDVELGGALLIKTDDGSMKRVLAGDLSLIPPQAEDE